MDDYKKLYEQALERAKQFSEKPYLEDSAGIVEYIFPELKESEDEKVKKEIKQFIRSRGMQLAQSKVESWIAWLEKQYEHARFREVIQVGDHVTKNEDGVLVNLSQLKRVAKKDEKQCEQKPYGQRQECADCQFNYAGECKGFCAMKRSEQKPVDSFIEEEEKPLFRKFKQAVYDCAWGKVTCKSEGETQEEYAERWAEQLLSIVRDWADDYVDSKEDAIRRRAYDKAVKEQKPAEWSEEDEKIIEDIIYSINSESVIEGLRSRGISYSIDRADNLTEKLIHWLKSLRPQNTWKPSDEQMDALEAAVSSLQSTALESLYNDLKKLKEK